VVRSSRASGCFFRLASWFGEPENWLSASSNELKYPDNLVPPDSVCTRYSVPAFFGAP
jgi:hypothetical protein